MRRLALLGVAAALAGASCASDPLDTYSVTEEDAPPATRAPLPITTTEPSADEPGEVTETELGAVFEPNGQTVEVRSLDNTFRDETVTIDAGTEIHWINGGRNDHNVLPVDDSLTWGVDRDTFVPGTEYSFVFDTPGVYPYYCSIHGTAEVGMIGAIIVEDPNLKE